MPRVYAYVAQEHVQRMLKPKQIASGNMSNYFEAYCASEGRYGKETGAFTGPQLLLSCSGDEGQRARQIHKCIDEEDGDLYCVM